MPFSRLAESALFCADFAVAPADLICLACAILLAVSLRTDTQVQVSTNCYGQMLKWSASAPVQSADRHTRNKSVP